MACIRTTYLSLSLSLTLYIYIYIYIYIDIRNDICFSSTFLEASSYGDGNVTPVACLFLRQTATGLLCSQLRCSLVRPIVVPAAAFVVHGLMHEEPVVHCAAKCSLLHVTGFYM